jgi:hypothetical protein
MSVTSPEPSAAPWPPPPPLEATACPRCKAPANCAPEPQVCAKCGRRFALHAGPLVDAGLTPPAPDPQAKRVKVRSAGLLLFHAGILEPDSIQEGTLDPVIGRLPVTSTSIGYRHVYTVAFWRSVDWIHAIFNGIAWAVTATFVVGGMREPGVLFFGIPFGLFTAWWTFRIYGVRRWHARVIGLKGQTIAVRFDKPWWNRRRFHRELLRRCGMPAAGMP